MTRPKILFVTILNNNLITGYYDVHGRRDRSPCGLRDRGDGVHRNCSK